MLFGEMFSGDPMRIAHIQFDLYGKYVSLVFGTARKKYLRAEYILGIDTELGEKLKEATQFDHRTIQDLHDVIAGKFRFQWLALKNQQFDFFKEPEPVSEDASSIAYKWKIFLESELETIFNDAPDLIKQVCLATIYANPDKRGCEAEDRIYEYTQRYKDFFNDSASSYNLLQSINEKEKIIDGTDI